jgi:hypothetical protein
MKCFSIGLGILSAFLMVGSVPPKPRDEYDVLIGLRNAMECSGTKSDIKMFCKKYPTSSSYCYQFLNNPKFPNFSDDDCKKQYDVMYDKCCGGLEWWWWGPRDEDDVDVVGLRKVMECNSGTKSDSDIKKFCKKYPTSSSFCDDQQHFDTDDKCRKGYDYMYGKCCGGLEWWAILLIVMAVVEVIGVIIGLCACRRGKADNGGVGQMNPNYAVAGAYGQAGNVYGPPGNVVGQPGKVYGQTQPVGALQHVYFEFNSTSAFWYTCSPISSVSQ